MTDYTSENDLKYIDGLDELPVVGEDSLLSGFEKDEKLEACQAGESKLEDDVNEGSTISNPGVSHSEAAAAWATYKLVVGMKAPDAATRGDSLDEGTERMQFADRVLGMYREIVDGITEAENTPGQSSDGADFRVFDY